MSLWAELKRRNVYKAGVAYLIVAWLIIQVVTQLSEPLRLPEWLEPVVIVLLGVGFPVVLLFAWAYELTPTGLRRTEDVSADESIAATTGQRLNYLLIGLVIGAVVTTGVFRIINGNPNAAQAFAAQLNVLEALIEDGDYEAAYGLANTLEDENPESEELAGMWSRFSVPNALTTTPRGATVFRSDYNDADEWEELGTTPLEARIPFGLSRLRFELDGYRSVLHTTRQGGVEMLGATTENQQVREIPDVVLDTEDSLPENMIRVSGWTQGPNQFQDFFLGRYEVTNREYKAFVNAGGYDRREFWQEPILIDGVEVSFEDSREFFVDTTDRPGPSTWQAGDYPDGEDDYPVTGVSWYEAMAYARFAGAELPTVSHWRRAELPTTQAWRYPQSNLSSSGPNAVTANEGLGHFGTYSTSGNAREWVYNVNQEGNRIVLGGSWVDTAGLAPAIGSAPPSDRSEINGFRLARTFDTAQVTAFARQLRPAQPIYPTLEAIEPVDDEVFRALSAAFAYDRTPLNAVIDETVESRSWMRQRITFDAAYDGPRMVIYLYLPKNRVEPFQAVLYFPNVWDSARTIEEDPFHVDFIVRDGRAIAYPMLAGGFERPDAIGLGAPWDTVATSRRLVEMQQDLRRTIDYLETRTDIDSEEIGFYGLSMGGFLSPSLLALEDRIRAAVVTVTGVFGVANGSERWPFPQTDPLTYIPRVTTPVLMLNGEYDYVAPPPSARTFYDLLGTPESDKKLRTAPAGHFVPRDVLVPETLAWFDEYLGRTGD